MVRYCITTCCDAVSSIVMHYTVRWDVVLEHVMMQWVVLFFSDALHIDSCWDAHSDVVMHTLALQCFLMHCTHTSLQLHILAFQHGSKNMHPASHSCCDALHRPSLWCTDQHTLCRNSLSGDNIGSSLMRLLHVTPKSTWGLRSVCNSYFGQSQKYALSPKIRRSIRVAEVAGSREGP